MVGAVGLEPTTSRLSVVTGYKPAALPLSYAPCELEMSTEAYSIMLVWVKNLFNHCIYQCEIVFRTY